MSANSSIPFKNLSIHGVLGAPVLDDAPVVFEGLILERHVFGDHTGYVLDPEAENTKAGGRRLEQLRLQDVSDITAGHPANERPAPSS